MPPYIPNRVVVSGSEQTPGRVLFILRNVLKQYVLTDTRDYVCVVVTLARKFNPAASVHPASVPIFSILEGQNIV